MISLLLSLFALFLEEKIMMGGGYSRSEMLQLTQICIL